MVGAVLIGSIVAALLGLSLWLLTDTGRRRDDD